ncbi:uncharacterized protein OCT59_007284 [Rhizophagus irregularis]|uniref:uncharacterized protein n=1 Tax=Rhizophagus irregularis TaxID=588596 RepID=UPI003331F316|nr:hypothetical protein OCT59_007284 [Rhizophagus irregularis]
MNELWKPGCETKERPENLRERTMVRNLDVRRRVNEPGFKRTNYGKKPGRETKEQPGFKRTNYGKKPGRETKLNDQDSKNELWKPGRETKLNDQDSKKRTNYGNLDVRRS